jgi:hypothetical protein
LLGHCALLLLDSDGAPGSLDGDFDVDTAQPGNLLKEVPGHYLGITTARNVGDVARPFAEVWMVEDCLSSLGPLWHIPPEVGIQDELQVLDEYGGMDKDIEKTPPGSYPGEGRTRYAAGDGKTTEKSL